MLLSLNLCVIFSFLLFIFHRLFQVIAHIDDCLALLNLVSVESANDKLLFKNEPVVYQNKIKRLLGHFTENRNVSVFVSD